MYIYIHIDIHIQALGNKMFKHPIHFKETQF